MEIELQHETRIVDFEFSDVPITDPILHLPSGLLLFVNKNVHFLNKYMSIYTKTNGQY